MTVPTNNEGPFVASNGYKVERLSDGQTKITRHTDGVFEAVTWCNPGEYLAVAEHALAARRLPVSVDNADATRAEAERRYPTGIVGLVRYEDWERDEERSAFMAGAEWQASQPREVEVSDARISSGQHRKVGMYGGSIEVCDTCVNSLGYNVAWDQTTHVSQQVTEASHVDAMRDIEGKAIRLYTEKMWRDLPEKAKANYRLSAAAALGGGE